MILDDIEWTQVTLDLAAYPAVSHTLPGTVTKEAVTPQVEPFSYLQQRHRRASSIVQIIGCITSNIPLTKAS